MKPRRMLTNETATLADLQSLIGKRVTIHRNANREYGVSKAFHKTGKILSAHDIRCCSSCGQAHGLGVMFKGEDFHTSLALPPDWPWWIKA